jgi:hypothetical protein
MPMTRAKTQSTPSSEKLEIANCDIKFRLGEGKGTFYFLASLGLVRRKKSSVE